MQEYTNSKVMACDRNQHLGEEKLLCEDVLLLGQLIFVVACVEIVSAYELQLHRLRGALVIGRPFNLGMVACCRLAGWLA